MIPLNVIVIGGLVLFFGTGISIAIYLQLQPWIQGRRIRKLAEKRGWVFKKRPTSAEFVSTGNDTPTFASNSFASLWEVSPFVSLGPVQASSFRNCCCVIDDQHRVTYLFEVKRNKDYVTQLSAYGIMNASDYGAVHEWGTLIDLGDNVTLPYLNLQPPLSITLQRPMILWPGWPLDETQFVAHLAKWKAMSREPFRAAEIFAAPLAQQIVRDWKDILVGVECGGRWLLIWHDIVPVSQTDNWLEGTSLLANEIRNAATAIRKAGPIAQNTYDMQAWQTHPTTN